jgi:hypothetical protein
MPPAGSLFSSIARHVALFIAYLLGLWSLGIISVTDRARLRDGIRTARISALSRALSRTAA